MNKQANSMCGSVNANDKLVKKLRALRKESDESKALAVLQRLCVGFERINPNAAGIDIASDEHWVCLPDDCCEDNVRQFRAYTVDLFEIRSWLLFHGVTSVAMESTGVYWIALYDVLEAAGIEVYLVNARELKSVCGRPKTDKLDCQWIQRLHTYGLLKRSFRPDADICQLRSLWRTRHSLTREVNRCIQRMQKALHEMNVLLPKVISDITGMTGMLIIRAIADGETDPAKLAEYRHHRVKKGVEEITEALRGTYDPTHVYVLKLTLAHYDFLLGQEDKLDQEVATRLQAMEAIFELSSEHRAENSKAAKAYKRQNKHAPNFDAQSRLHELLGVDMCQVPGLSTASVLGITLEVGLDMTRWADEGHFSSWLSLSPNPNISAGKDLGTSTKKSSNRAAYYFRMAAQSLQFSGSYLGSFYRRMKARNGPAHAITATAHKLAIIYYLMVSRGEDYKEMDASEYNQIIEQQRIQNMKRRAQKEGFELVAKTPDAQAKLDKLEQRKGKSA